MPAVSARKREVVAEVPAGKRAKAAEEPKPKAKADPVNAKILVLRAALEAGDLEVPGTAANRDMLKEMLSVLATPQNSQNEHQKAMTGMLVEVFEKEEARLQQRVQAVQVKVDGDNGEIAGCEAAIESAKAAKQAKKEEINEKEEHLDEAEVVLQDAEAEMKATLDGRNKVGAKVQELASEKEKFINVQRNSFEVLKDGSWELGKEHKSHLAALKQFFVAIGLNTSLLSAYPSALGKKPEERGEFDNMVLQELSEAVAASLATLEEKHAKAAEEDSEQAGLVTASEAIVGVANEKRTARANEVEAAKEGLAGLEAALVEARKAAKDRRKLASGNANELKGEQSVLDCFREHVLGALRFLQERETEKPAEEPAP